jgi:hypothetical protein
MVLDLGKLLSLYWTTVSAFFEPGSRWQERLLAALLRLTIAGCVCFASGLIFCWPAKANPDAGQALTATLPVRMFFWGAAAIAALFAVSWYLVCGAPCLPSIVHACVCR